MSEPEFVTVTITAPDHEQLASICHTLVEERLAACGNVLRHVTSVYRWQGQIEQEPEALALIHTRRALFEQLAARVAELHPYVVPQIVALPLDATTESYGAWLAESTAPQISHSAR